MVSSPKMIFGIARSGGSLRRLNGILKLCDAI
jgi:hypothetical protein